MLRQVLRTLLDIRHLPDLMLLAMVFLVQAAGAALLIWSSAGARSVRVRWAVGLGLLTSWSILMLGFLLRFARVNRYFSTWWPSWGSGLALMWAFSSVLLVVALVISRWGLRVQAEHSPARRAFLRTSQVALLCAPAVVTGYGVFIQRHDLSLREKDLDFPGLPEDLHGLRLVQLTDIHLSPFLSERELARAVDMANETRAHVALVTGDLITTAHDPLDACLRQLSRLRADAGVFGCLGNHEIYANAEDYVEKQGARLGHRYLRQRAESLKFGQATLNLAGVDYQRTSKPYLQGAERMVAPESFNVLLSHNPDVFPVAARQGYQLTLAGHTHGGQVRVEILTQDLNIARFFTPYVDGLYRRDRAAIFVSRGIGTIGLPARLGAPPEVNLLRLCRT
ncbi:MAG: metallophosphoesterase [Bryobacterales bacterium]|nr:metallophosphoesterase [Bryobacterales bacterium]